MSTVSDLAARLPSKTLPADSRSCFFHAEICAGCTPKIWANSAAHLSPFSASSATFALKSGLKLFRLVVTSTSKMRQCSTLSRCPVSGVHFKLRNSSGEIMRGLDAGKTYVVPRNGVTVGELTPLRRHRVVRAEQDDDDEDH